MKQVEKFLEGLIFNSRWLLAPFYLGLVLSIVLLLIKFIKEFTHVVPVVLWEGGSQVIVGILSLVDIVLVANLLLIIVFAGYENFVSKINTGEHEDRPTWMGHVGFTDLKIKLIGSIVAISGIELLKAFVNVQTMTTHELAWRVGIHLTFVVSGVLFALMDRIAEGGKPVPAPSRPE
ncbi:MAG: TIGR00645 family protein [Nitrospiria bacterium]